MVTFCVVYTSTVTQVHMYIVIACIVLFVAHILVHDCAIGQLIHHSTQQQNNAMCVHCSQSPYQYRL